MSSPKGPLALSLLIIAIGVGWLLSALGVLPVVNWIWSLGLGGLGVLTFVVVGGIDKVNVVIGPLLIAASGLSVLRQTRQLSFDVEVPMLVILVGILLFVSQLRIVPVPSWYEPAPPPRECP